MKGFGVWNDVAEILGMLIFVAAIGMLVRNSSNTSELIKTSADSFGSLLRTATGADYFV